MKNSNELMIQVGIPTLNYTKHTIYLFSGNAAGFDYDNKDGYYYYYSLYRSADNIIYNEGKCVGWIDGSVYLLRIYYR